jgi:serpin B
MKKTIYIIILIISLILCSCTQDEEVLISDNPSNAFINNSNDNSEISEQIEEIENENTPNTPDTAYNSERSTYKNRYLKNSVYEEIIEDSYRNSYYFIAGEMLKGSIGEDNILLSPFSLYLSLSFLANMSSGETLSEFEALMGMPINELREYSKYLIEQQLDWNESKTLVAYSLWLNSLYGLEPQSSFLENNELYFGADIFNVDFSYNTIGDMNEWAEEKTEGIIKKIINDLPYNAVAIIINTLYFEAHWQGDYETFNCYFNNYNGSLAEKSFFNGKAYGYYASETAKAFQIGLNDNYYFVGVLPNENNIDEYLENFDGEEIYALLNNYITGYDVYWRIPEFKYDYSEDLENIIKNMSITKAFQSDADFSALTGKANGLFINKISQKTSITLDKEGVSAAAATIISCGSAFPKEPYYLYLDRPFVYMIVDGRTDVPLFIGTVRNL